MAKRNNMWHVMRNRELSNTEVSRLRLTYGLIRDHAQAAARGVEEVDPTTNPLLDPRSVCVDKHLLVFSYQLTNNYGNINFISEI